MVSFIPYRVLSFSDKMLDRFTYGNTNKERFSGIELLFSCGDLPYYYLEGIYNTFEAPLFFVRGNHDKDIEYGVSGTRSEPLGGIDMHRRMVNYNNLLILGFEGSIRYRPGPFMYTQGEMWRFVVSMIPRLLVNKFIYGRYFDVLLTHAPPWGIHDKEDRVHQGFKAFRWLIKTFKPGYHFHGHIHLYTKSEISETIYRSTKVINTYGYKESTVRPGKRHYQDSGQTPFYRVSLTSAAEDFRHARRKAALQTVLSAFTGKSTNLMSFDKVRQQLGMEAVFQLGLQTIPLDAIVGSVGRFEDFTRAFFPKYDSDGERWSRVKSAISHKEEMPPIDVYKIGEVYFVLDGNHRVSIARENGDTHIRAYVTEIETKVPLSPRDQPDDLIIKAQQVKFLEDTRLDEFRPEVDFSVTFAGSYRQLREQIAVHHFLLELRQQWPVDYQEAVIDWVDNEYIPMLRIIQSLGLLRDFPGRTPADLYLWMVRHQNELAETIGWQVRPERVAEDLVRRYSSNPLKILNRIKNRILQAVIPKTLDPGPSTGEWRKLHSFPRKEGVLFSSILVAISGGKHSWRALNQALLVAQREGGSVRGIIVIPPNQSMPIDRFQKIRRKFESKCAKVKIDGELVVESGQIAPEIVSRTRWSDLMVVGIEHPPKNQLISRLRSGLRTMIQTSPRPVLAVPESSPMKKALVAFDGSSKAQEALYLGAYLAKNWGIGLVVMTATHSGVAHAEPIKRARRYIRSRQLEADYIHCVGEPGDMILETAKDTNCDFIIMGGYGYKPFFEVVYGSTVDHVLRNYQSPIFICR